MEKSIQVKNTPHQLKTKNSRQGHFSHQLKYLTKQNKDQEILEGFSGNIKLTQKQQVPTGKIVYKILV